MLEPELVVPLELVVEALVALVPAVPAVVLEVLFLDKLPDVELALEASGWFFFHFFKMLENLKVLS